MMTFLQGKKTYFTVALAVFYVGGPYLGFWDMKDEVLAGLGLGALAFLRAGIKKAEPDAFAARKVTLLALQRHFSVALVSEWD
jgi:hypothetical protein